MLPVKPQAASYKLQVRLRLEANSCHKMKSPDRVFQLIKSLTKQEKWYFKAFAKWNSLKDDSNYIRLFDLMDSQKEHDEKKLKQKLGNHPLAKSFAETKYQLYSSLLKSLHAYHINSSVDNRLKTFLHQIEILFNKAMYDEALRLTLQAKKLAGKYESFTELLDLLEWERLAVVYSFTPDRMNERLEEVIRERNEIIDRLKNFSSYNDLGDRLYVLHVKSGVVRDEKILKRYKSLMSHPLLKNVSKAASYEAKATFYYCHKIFAFAIQDAKDYYKFSQLHVKALEEKPQMIEDRMTRYIGSLYSLAMAQNDVRRYDDFLHTIGKMRAIPEKFKSGRLELNRLKIFEQTYREELSYYSYTGQFERGNAIVKEVMEGMERYRKLLTEQAVILFYYELAKTKFGVKRYKESLDFINRIINNTETGTREDVVAVLRIMQLIIHYELGNNMLLPYIVKSTYRYLYKKERLYKMETVILQYLRKLERIRTQKELIDSFRILRSELAKLAKDPYEKIGLDYFDFISWLDCRIEKKEFAEVVRKKAMEGKEA